MRIGIVGAGTIGSLLARRLARAGHDVAVANSRAPETVERAALSTGARPMWARQVTDDAELVVVSVNFGQLPAVAEVVAGAPAGAVVVDTSNYWPHRDGAVPAVDDGQVEGLYVQELLGRPVTRAWTTINAASLVDRAAPRGSAGRIALPVVADDDAHRGAAMALVELTGFDPYDAGTLADGWRLQPGTPAYTTDLSLDELPGALAAADRSRSARRRDLMWAVAAERVEPGGGGLSAERQLALARAVF